MYYSWINFLTTAAVTVASYRAPLSDMRKRVRVESQEGPVHEGPSYFAAKIRTQLRQQTFLYWVEVFEGIFCWKLMGP